jgi:hypothetical protein
MALAPTAFIPPACDDVLNPDFAELNAAAGYDPGYDYGGSDWIYRHTGVAIKRYWFGSDINPAFWIHDKRYDHATTVEEWDAANDEFRDNVAKLIQAHGHPWLAWCAGWLGWLGVQSLAGLIDFYLCAKEQEMGIERTA